MELRLKLRRMLTFDLIVSTSRRLQSIWFPSLAEWGSCQWYFMMVQMKSLTPPLMLTHCVLPLCHVGPHKQAHSHLPASVAARPNQTIWPGYATLTTVTFAVLLSLCSSGSGMQMGPTWIIFSVHWRAFKKGGNCGWRRRGLLSLMSELSNRIWKQSFNVWYADSVLSLCCCWPLLLMLLDLGEAVQCSCLKEFSVRFPGSSAIMSSSSRK